MRRSRPITFPNSHDLRIYSRGRLPHWELANAPYFVTYRLEDALPHDVIVRLEVERQAIERSLTGGGRAPSATESAQISRMYGRRLDSYLDAGYGACHLRRSEIAQIVVDNWSFFDGKRYDLFAWCVMPNHVHLIFRLFEDVTLGQLFHSWKSYTANRANSLLGVAGPFWQREYFDRIIRDQREFGEDVEYVLGNPRRIGMTNWPFVGSKFW